MMRSIKATTLCVLMLFSAAITNWAQDLDGKELVVATKEAPPFVMKQADGVWSGLTIEFLRLLEKETGAHFTFQEMELEEMLKSVEQGNVDLAAAAITASPEREERVDFSHAYFPSGLGLAYRAKETGVWAAAKNLFSVRFFQAVGVLSLVIAAAGLAIWFFERK